MNTTAIAQHLNIIDSAIIEIQEWATVLWVKFQGGCRFVSKKINEVTQMTELTFIAGKGFGADVIINDEKLYYSELHKADQNLYVVSDMLGNFFDYNHCQIALDAGGEIVESEINKWGETILKKVSVESDKMIAYCKKLKAARNPHAGMMQTSTGEWVLADDWDIIEGNH